MRRRLLFLGLMLLAGAPAALAQTAPAEGPWGLLEYAETEPVRGLDPYRLETARGATDRLFALLYEGLLRYDYDEELYRPLLAERYDVEPGGSVTFFLRDGVRWHDGEPFTAEDVRFTYEYIRRLAPPQVRKPYQDLSIEIIDPLTIRATFEKPPPDPLQFFDAWLLPAHRFAGFQPRGGQPTLATLPVGTGPYRFRKQSIEGHVSLEINLDYWGEEGRIQGVKMNKVTDPSQMVLSAMYGNHRLLIQVPPGQLTTLAALKTFNIELYPSFAIYAFAYNNTHPALRHALVRRALTYATDRQTMLDQWFNGKGHLIASPFNNASPYFDPSVEPFPYDPDTARRLLEQAGYTDRDGDGLVENRAGEPLRLRLVNFVEKAASATTNQNLAASYRSNLADVGVAVELIDLPLDAYRKRLFLDKDFDVALVQWTFDPIYDVTDLFESSARDGNNIVRYRSPEADDLIARFRDAADPEARLALMRSLQRLLANDCPYTFVLSIDKHAALHRSLAGYRIDPYFFFSYFTQWYFPEDFRD